MNTQQTRITLLHQAHRRANAPRFGVNGEWLGKTPPPSVRERCWHALAFLTGDEQDIAVGNRILAGQQNDRNDFMAFFATLLLRLHEPRLTEPVKNLLTETARANLPHVAEHIFRYTQNCAMLNCFALLEGAERFGESAYRDRAIGWLELAVHRHRQGLVSLEFFSGNYHPVSLNGAAVIETLVADKTARALAAELQDAFWRELAMVWHLGLRYVAGPSGRSYTVDSVAGSSLVRQLVWLTLGDAASPSPMDLGLYDEPPRCYVKNHDAPNTQAEGAWISCVPYRVEPATAALFQTKQYPAQVAARTILPAWREYEKIDSPAQARAMGGWANGNTGYAPGTLLHPGGEARLTAHLEPDFGLGTSSRVLWTQCDFLYALWRRQGDRVRSLFTRFVFNDALEKLFGPDQCAELLPEQGRGGALQSGPLAVAWYAGSDVQTSGITKLRTCVLLPGFDGDVEEIVTEGAWTFIQIGRAHV